MVGLVAGLAGFLGLAVGIVLGLLLDVYLGVKLNLTRRSLPVSEGATEKKKHGKMTGLFAERLQTRNCRFRKRHVDILSTTADDLVPMSSTEGGINEKVKILPACANSPQFFWRKKIIFPRSITK